MRWGGARFVGGFGAGGRVGVVVVHAERAADRAVGGGRPWPHEGGGGSGALRVHRAQVWFSWRGGSGGSGWFGAGEGPWGTWRRESVRLAPPSLAASASAAMRSSPVAFPAIAIVTRGVSCARPRARSVRPVGRARCGKGRVRAGLRIGCSVRVSTTRVSAAVNAGCPSQ